MEAYLKKRTFKRSKTSEILRYMESHDGITSAEAFEKFGATRLSAIIFCLRKKGYNIETKERVGIDRYGRVNYFAEYVLVKNQSDKS